MGLVANPIVLHPHGMADDARVARHHGVLDQDRAGLVLVDMVVDWDTVEADSLLGEGVAAEVWGSV